jgi:hypothetical protein
MSYWKKKQGYIREDKQMNKISVEEIAKVIEPLIHEVFETDDTSVLAQALFDRIYGKGECEQCGACEELIIPEHVKEFANKYGIGLDVIYEYALRWAELKVMKKFNKRNYDAIAQEIKETITDKPKEYCKPFKERYGIEIDGKWTPLSELPHEIEELNKLIKPIKTEKIEQFDKNVDYGLWHTRVEDKLNEVIDHINKKGGSL